MLPPPESSLLYLQCSLCSFFKPLVRVGHFSPVVLNATKLKGRHHFSGVRMAGIATKQAFPGIALDHLWVSDFFPIIP